MSPEWDSGDDTNGASADQGGGTSSRQGGKEVGGGVRRRRTSGKKIRERHDNRQNMDLISTVHGSDSPRSKAFCFNLALLDPLAEFDFDGPACGLRLALPAWAKAANPCAALETGCRCSLSG